VEGGGGGTLGVTVRSEETWKTELLLMTKEYFSFLELSEGMRLVIEIDFVLDVCYELWGMSDWLK
jgi:hypothetical protein